MLELVRRFSHHHMILRGATVRRRTFGDVDLGYYELGKGSVPALLIHGIGDRSVHFQGVAMALRSHLRMTIPDLPGCGMSTLPAGATYLNSRRSREMLHDLMAPYADARPLLIGHSLGGLYAAQMALEAPGRYRGVVLINPGGFLPADPAPQMQDFRQFLAESEPHVILNKAFYRPPFYYRIIAKGLQAQMRSPIVQDHLAAMTREDLLSGSQISRLGRDDLLFCGRQDDFLPPGCLQGWNAYFPGETIWLDGSAHASQFERADLIARRIATRVKTGWQPSPAPSQPQNPASQSLVH